MLLTITGLIALALAATARFRARGDASAVLGWMSEQWLAYHRGHRM